MLAPWIEQWGYWAVGVGAFLEGEAVLVAGGALAHSGMLSLPLVMLVAFLGSFAGDQLWFQVGRRCGRPLLARRPSWQANVQQAEAQLERYGDAFVFGFRFIYGIRSITPALLGMSSYPLRRFACLNLAGAALWALLVGLAGWALGAAFTRTLQQVAQIQGLLVGVGGIALAAFLLWRRVRRSAVAGRTDIGVAALEKPLP